MGVVVLKNDAVATEEELLKFFTGNVYFLPQIKIVHLKIFQIK